MPIPPVDTPMVVIMKEFLERYKGILLFTVLETKDGLVTTYTITAYGFIIASIVWTRE